MREVSVRVRVMYLRPLPLKQLLSRTYYERTSVRVRVRVSVSVRVGLV